MAGQLIARVRATKRRRPSDENTSPVGVNIVRWPFHVGVNDHPRQPLVHSGYTMDLERARTLGAAIIAGRGARVNTNEGVVLIFEPQHPRLREAIRDESWTFPEDQVPVLGNALIAAADAVEGLPTATSPAERLR